MKRSEAIAMFSTLCRITTEAPPRCTPESRSVTIPAHRRRGPSDHTFHERHDIPREALRLLPVGPMPGALVHDQPRIRDRRQESDLIATGTERIPVAPDDQ